MCIWCLFTTQFSLVILCQISVACSESWYQKLEFCVTSFWFYYHWLWWSSWHAMLALFLLYVFLVWIFSWCDLFQITATDASCILYIICSQFITFEHVKLCSAYWAWLVALLTSPYAILLNLILQLTSEFSLSCSDLFKVSTEDSDHVIYYMVVLIVDTDCNCFYIIFSILLVWHRSDLFNVSL